MTAQPVSLAELVARGMSSMPAAPHAAPQGMPQAISHPVPLAHVVAAPVARTRLAPAHAAEPAMLHAAAYWPEVEHEAQQNTQSRRLQAAVFALIRKLESATRTTPHDPLVQRQQILRDLETFLLDLGAR